MKTGRYQMLKEHHHVDERKDKKRSVSTNKKEKQSSV
jgi:hypothetical protein